jgi:hypothetical protein
MAPVTEEGKTFDLENKSAKKTAIEYDGGSKQYNQLFDGLKLLRGEEVMKEHNAGDDGQTCESIIWGWYVLD